MERWDWAYWSEKLRLKRFNIDDEALQAVTCHSKRSRRQCWGLLQATLRTAPSRKTARYLSIINEVTAY
ncbi:MAG: hypothetical protein MZV63_20600 [Marinilabiliales bacterium]|nr:hypothetical protein [Marinilabiliales bacterium]